MNGATLEPVPKAIKKPTNPNIIKIGYNQYFFLSFIKTIYSFRKLIIEFACPIRLNPFVS